MQKPTVIPSSNKLTLRLFLIKSKKNKLIFCKARLLTTKNHFGIAISNPKNRFYLHPSSCAHFFLMCHCRCPMPLYMLWSFLTAYIFVAKLCTRKNVCLPKWRTFLEDVISQSELTTITTKVIC